MYIHRAKRKSTSGRIHTSVLLQHSYREDGKTKHKTILNLSKWSGSEVAALEAMLKGKRGFDINDLKTTEGKYIGGVYVFNELAKQIGITKALGKSKQGKLALLLIIGRILTQGSRRKLCYWKEEQEIESVLGISDFSTDDLYKTLDWLAEKQAKIEDKLFKMRHPETINLFLYDVTSSYLEGDENELGAWGYNRDKKRGKKQIVIGLLTDSEGVPVTVEVFKGNTKDTETMSSQIEKCTHRFGVKNITMVGDRGMIKAPQKEVLTEEHYSYITAITKPQINKLLTDDIIQMSLFDNEIAEVEYQKEDKKTEESEENYNRYILRKNPYRKKEIEDNRNQKISAAQDYMSTLTAYLENHPKASFEVAYKKAMAYLKKLNIASFVVPVISTELSNKKRIVNVFINESKKEEIRLLDGCYVLHTDLSPNTLSKEAVHQRYKDLALVETAFRTLKMGCLEIRPIFVRKSSRTKGHVFLSMLSYMLVQRLWKSTQSLNLPLSHMIELICSIKTVVIQLGETSTARIPEITQKKKDILKQLNIELPKTIA
tara:strand:+ start:141 stop:1772 length:1632 start_codon:yes stop_codon:yes gene_type:complete